MAANTSPIYSIAGHIESAVSNNAGTMAGPTANTSTDGSGTLIKIFTAGTNGSYIQKIRFRPVAASAGSVAATVCRVFISNSATTSTTATWLYDEITLPAVTMSNTAASSVFELPMNFALPTGQYLFVTFGTSTGTTPSGYSIVVIAGDY
jgi:hypothetical protein